MPPCQDEKGKGGWIRERKSAREQTRKETPDGIPAERQPVLPRAANEGEEYCKRYVKNVPHSAHVRLPHWDRTLHASYLLWFLGGLRRGLCILMHTRSSSWVKSLSISKQKRISKDSYCLGVGACSMVGTYVCFAPCGCDCRPKIVNHGRGANMGRK